MLRSFAYFIHIICIIYITNIYKTCQYIKGILGVLQEYIAVSCPQGEDWGLPVIQGPVRGGYVFDQNEKPSNVCLIGLEFLLILQGAPREASSVLVMEMSNSWCWDKAFYNSK